MAICSSTALLGLSIDLRRIKRFHAIIVPIVGTKAKLGLGHACLKLLSVFVLVRRDGVGAEGRLVSRDVTTLVISKAEMSLAEISTGLTLNTHLSLLLALKQGLTVLGGHIVTLLAKEALREALRKVDGGRLLGV